MPDLAPELSNLDTSGIHRWRRLIISTGTYAQVEHSAAPHGSDRRLHNVSEQFDIIVKGG